MLINGTMRLVAEIDVNLGIIETPTRILQMKMTYRWETGFDRHRLFNITDLKPTNANDAEVGNMT